MSPPIYATPTGARFHGSVCCNGLNAYDTSVCGERPAPTVTRAEARRRRLTPCSVCRPSPLLTVAS